ncbi:MAG: type II CRISPR RNA-guided endonuclease Cas9, partial [Gammaproteobacteria bacterium]
MPYTLGLDLGSSSLGWALIDEEGHKIIDTGVRVFPGAAEAGTTGTRKEKYRNEIRRESRQARRQTYRRVQRRIALLEVLQQFDLCPVTAEEIKAYKKYTKGQQRVFPASKAFEAWIKLNPYELRDKALHENISRHECGRIFYHIIHHRGFKTGRKSKEDGALYKGTDTTIGIDDTKSLLTQYKTLGAYLHAIQAGSGNRDRLRGRYTLRTWYIEEFHAIWDRQAEHLGLDKDSFQLKRRHYYGKQGSYLFRRKEASYKARGVDYIVVDGDYFVTQQQIPLRDYLGDPNTGILFYQKPLKSQKHLLSRCRFEKDKQVCMLSHPLFECFRALQFINNLEYGRSDKLSADERRSAFAYLQKASKTVTMKALKKYLKLHNETFNYPDDDKIPCCTTIQRISTLTKQPFSQDHWPLYHEIWDYLLFYDDADKLYQKIQDRLPERVFKDADKKLLKAADLPDGYASVSLKAIKNIIPFLERGLMYDRAAVCGGIKRVLEVNDIPVDLGRIADDVGKLQQSEGDLLDELHKHMQGYYGLSAKDCVRLYHHSREVSYKSLTQDLPQLPNLRNPIVQQALQELRTVVNSISREHLKNGENFSSIKVELARELKLPKELRRRMDSDNRTRNTANEAARVELQSFGLSPSRDNVQKYKLWKEIQQQNGTVQCPYTGKTLSISDVFGSANRVQVEHIVPRSVSLDDGLANKTLCDAEENGRKGDCTPYDFYKNDPERWELIKQRAFRLLPYGKAKRFVSESEPKGASFRQRQLNDTRYMSKVAKEYLSAICARVDVLPGALTSNIRHLWGLNGLLDPPIQTGFEFPMDDKAYNRFWGVLNDAGEVIELSEQELAPPQINAVQVLVSGAVKKGQFVIDKRYLGNAQERAVPVMQINDQVERDGAGWMLYRIDSIDKWLPKYTQLPEVHPDQFWFKGTLKSDQSKQKLNLHLRAFDTTVQLAEADFPIDQY